MVRRRGAGIDEDNDEDRQRRSAAARDLQLPTRTSREGKRVKSKNCCYKFCSRCVSER